MDEQDPEKVLKKDLERLKSMNQSDVVEDQLKVNFDSRDWIQGLGRPVT